MLLAPPALPVTMMPGKTLSYSCRFQNGSPQIALRGEVLGSDARP